MHKFFTPAHMFSDTHAKITGEDVKHIYKVLRVKPGEKVVVNNLESEEFLGEVEEVNKQEVSIKILEKLDVNNESNLNITLFQGMPKAAKMDLIVQKCVELGVSEIIPTITDRVDVKLKGEFKKLDRLNKIALEACKQSKRTVIPEVLEPMDFKGVLEKIDELDLMVIPYENATGYGIRAMVNSIENKDSIKGYRSAYNKATETAKAGYYSVELTDYHIKVESSATPHCGILHFTYPSSDQSRIQID